LLHLRFNLQFLTGSPLLWEWIDLAHGHEVLNILVGDLLSLLLEVGHELLQLCDEEGLDFSGEELSLAVLLSNFFELVVVFHEEGEVLVGHIHVQVSSVGSVLLDSGATTTLGKLVDLLFYLGSGVGQKDSAIGD
jgi:hypothetical protein